MNTHYNPLTGEGCVGTRKRIYFPTLEKELNLPVAMTHDHRFYSQMNPGELRSMRIFYDFEYWAFTALRIKEKGHYRSVPFRLNDCQRYCLQEFERQREAGQPVRIIILKARQWGCSTLVDAYIAWHQLVLFTHANSIICANTHDATSTIYSMYSRILESYPRPFLHLLFEQNAYFCDGGPCCRSPHKKAQDNNLDYIDVIDELQCATTDDKAKNTDDSASKEGRVRLIKQRDSNGIYELYPRKCTVQLVSANSANSARGSDLSIAHFSEVAFWGNSPTSSRPSEVVNSICSSIDYVPGSIIIMESTANGVGNYFHEEWLRCASSRGDKVAVFVPWYLNKAYSRELDRPKKVIMEALTQYERSLLQNRKITLEQVWWYHCKALAYPSLQAMQQEFPTTPEEAFSSSERSVFSSADVERLRPLCCPPIMVGELVGEDPNSELALRSIHFLPEQNGRLKVWEDVRQNARPYDYVVSVDIGGCHDSSDFSVISVLCIANPECPEVVAQWRGHTHYDTLAWKSATIAKYYCNALLIIESNSFETRFNDGDNGEYILQTISRHYRNLYTRSSAHYGFHTNSSTKRCIINNLVKLVRDGSYIERDDDALNELLAYEYKDNGSMGAVDGAHDDILMSRAIALYIACDRIERAEMRSLATVTDLYYSLYK